MDHVIQLAVYAGKLEARLEALEARVKELEEEPAGNVFQVNTAPESPVPEPAEEPERPFRMDDKKMQEGLSNILAYTGAPQGGKEG